MALVFGTSFCVLVLEILAGRLLAPLIGVSLETFTGIIGTVLAGIAVGNAAGGRLADRLDPGRLIGPTVLLGGLLSWLAPVLVTGVGPVGRSDPVTIVFLAVITFFAPAAVLSAITPMVAKLRLRDLGATGTVVGSLSAAGTAGALAGTFLTGFVLVAAFPTRRIIFVIGLVLVVVGTVLTGWNRVRANLTAAVLIGPVGLAALALPGPCDLETAYACVEIVPDRGRPTGRSLVLNGLRNSYVDLADPTYLDFRYMRLFAAVTASLPAGPLDGLHIGGAGLTYPRHISAVRPGSRATVLELDGELIEVAGRDLGFHPREDIEVLVGDARLTIAHLADDSYDVIVGDAFSGMTIPWHLTTDEFVTEVDRVLRPDGVVVLNLIDGGRADFARAQLATYRTRFANVGLIVPQAGLAEDRPRNLIAVASHRPLPAVDPDPDDGRLLSPAETDAFIGDAAPLRDDFAPVDQLRAGP
ncbi:MAG: fused MFS/spermidine synthase [Acidimicrobiia bacterium]|nr:fused MFS/spermidine synthase [Acidimicrobiia bacterium]